MRPFTATWAVLLCLVTTPLLRAQETSTAESQPPGKISLEECIRQAIEHNLRIQISRVDPQANRLSLQGSYSMYDPRFEASYIHSERTRAGDVVGGTVIFPNDSENDNINTSIVGEGPLGFTYDIGFRTAHQQEDFLTPTGAGSTDNYDTDFGIDMRLPLLRNMWINPNRATIRVNKHLLRGSEYALLYTIMTVVRDVQAAYYDLTAAKELVRAREKALERATLLFEENKKRVEAGVLAPLDEKQAEAEVATSRAALISARANVVKQQNLLKNLISDNYERWSPVALEPTQQLVALPESYNRAESWAAALERRPDFNQLKTDLERQGVEVKLAFNQLFPSLDVIGSYGRSGLDTDFSGSWRNIEDDDQPRHSFGVILSIPLSNRDARYGHRRARELFRQMELRIKEMHQSIIIDVDNAIIDAESFFEQIDAQRQARLFAQAALDAEEKKLANGKSTSFFVLQFQRDLIDAQAAEIQALTDYNKALSELYYREGTILERNNIAVEFK